jgi:hypothetical protein
VAVPWQRGKPQICQSSASKGECLPHRAQNNECRTFGLFGHYEVEVLRGGVARFGVGAAARHDGHFSKDTRLNELAIDAVPASDSTLRRWPAVALRDPSQSVKDMKQPERAIRLVPSGTPFSISMPFDRRRRR